MAKSSADLLFFVDPSYIESLFGIFSQAVQSAKAADSKAAGKAPSSFGLETELEVRLGSPGGFNRDHWNFDSSIDRVSFEVLKARLDASSSGVSVKPQESVVTIRSTGRDENVRRIVTGTGAEASTRYQLKSAGGKAVNVDQPFLSTPVLPSEAVHDRRNVHILRIALAEERSGDFKTAFEAAPASSEVVRRRTRYSYPFTNYSIDLTIVDGKYSVELEFSQAFLKGVDSSAADFKSVALRTLLMPPIKFLIHNTFPELKIIQALQTLQTQYTTLLGGYRDVQPKNIKEEQVPDLQQGYSFTNKLNGTRYRLLIDKFKYMNYLLPMIFLVSGKDIRFVALNPADAVNAKKASEEKAKELPVSGFLETHSGTLLDTELFFYQGKPEIHAFDAFVMDKKSLLDLSLSDRLGAMLAIGGESAFDQQLNEIVGRYGLSFEVKRFFYSGPGKAAEDMKEAVAYMYERYGDAIEENNDGLIETPLDGLRRSRSVYKWKFPSTVSIDFALQEIAGFERDGHRIRVFNLMLYDKDKHGLVQFGPFAGPKGKYYNPPGVFLLPDTNPAFATLQSGQIAELGFDRPSNQFQLMKVRLDKVDPNALVPTGQDTFVDMATEFTLQKLQSLLTASSKAVGSYRPGPIKPGVFGLRIATTEAVAPPAGGDSLGMNRCLETYREYHNRVKIGLIQSQATRKKVLDLGAGKGGDLGKWNHAEIKFLWAVEPNKDSLEKPKGFMDRLSKLPERFRANTYVINSGAENTAFISSELMASQPKWMSTSQAEVVSSFFSMSFFFKDAATLKALVATVTRNLEYGGKFIGTMLDGGRVYEELKTAPGGRITDPDPVHCYSIQRKYREGTPLGIGLEIVINYAGTATVEKDQVEWLSPFELLRAELAAENIILEESLFFDDVNVKSIWPKKVRGDETAAIYGRLTAGERKLNRLYRYFIFQKKRPVQSEEKKAAEKVRHKAETKNSLDSLEMDEKERLNVVLPSVYPEKLVRIGAVGEGSCFYHSMLYLMFGKLYTRWNETERRAFAADTRTDMAYALSPEVFRQLGNGDVEVQSRFPRDYVREDLQDALIDSVLKAGEKPAVTTGQLGVIIDAAAKHPNMDDQSYAISEALKEKYGYDEDEILEIIDDARIKLWRNYRAQLQNCSTFTNHDSMEYLLRTSGRNIFVIEDTTRRPIKFADCSLYDPAKPSIVILNLKDAAHFEPVTGQDGQRSFTWDHPLIQSLYKEICNMPMSKQGGQK
jgi:hypothetical protein